MKTWFDTEFTEFLEPRLISIGMAREDGARFYAVLSDTWAIRDCSAWVRQWVLPWLGAPAQSIHQVQHDLQAFLAGCNELICDSEYDREMFHTLFSQGLSWLRLIVIPADEARLDAQVALQGGRRHHALDDAVALAALSREDLGCRYD